ncbi:MAG: hypothetical protein KDD61_10655 [Bdellovibrionales bacterium]|nr:hypothetical protein [Bdellovibrionales bacterium]
MLESPLTNNLESHWISQIKKFDHWNIFNIPYVKNKIRDIGPRDSIEKVTVFSSLPIPEIRELAYWGVLYAIHKIKLNQSKEGLETLRHIAFLSTTTHTLIGQAIAVSVLRYETILAKHFQIRNWEMISENRIEALKRSSWGWASLFSNNLFWGDIDSRWKKYYFTQTGFCAGLNEFPIGVNLLAEFLTDSAPFEDKFSLRLDTSRKAALHFAQSCQSEGLIPFLKQGERIPMWGKSEALWMTFFSRAPISTSWMKSLVQLLPNPAHVPYLRRVIGLYIYSIATPNFLGPYRNLKAKKSPI